MPVACDDELRPRRLRAFQSSIIWRIAHYAYALQWPHTPRRRLDVLPRLGNAFLRQLEFVAHYPELLSQDFFGYGDVRAALLRDKVTDRRSSRIWVVM